MHGSVGVHVCVSCTHQKCMHPSCQKPACEDGQAAVSSTLSGTVLPIGLGYGKHVAGKEGDDETTDRPVLCMQVTIEHRVQGHSLLAETAPKRKSYYHIE